LELSEYQELAAIENQHWYYVWRKEILRELFARIVVPALRAHGAKDPLNLLDVGCGTGGTSVVFAGFGTVDGLEPHATARRHVAATAAGLVNLLPVGGVDDLPALVGGTKYDAATVIGVLYHRNIPDPAASIVRIGACVKPGGFIVWNDAAYPELFRRHDRRVHAVRRFKPDEMAGMLQEAGFEPVFRRNLLGWSYPVALLMAWRDRLSRMDTVTAGDAQKVAAEQKVPGKFFSLLLLSICRFEWMIGNIGITPPRGVNHLIIARKSL
jgi:SAM-dependent methyltransferase